MIRKREAERRIDSAISNELRSAALNNLLENNKFEKDHLQGWISILLLSLFSSLAANAILVLKILETQL